MGTCYSHLSPDERIRIERLHCEQGLSVRETAGLVGRDKATVSRELKRGLWFASNGTEASCHQLVDEALGMPAYFADPYSSWRRGTNENRNGGIRRYLPKKTPFDDLTQAELDAIVQETDDTPMKQLEYKTPNEAWDEETSRLQSKTTNPTTCVALTS